MSTLELIQPNDFPAALAMGLGLIAVIYTLCRLFSWAWRCFWRWSDVRDAKIVDKRISDGWRDAALRHERLASFDFRAEKEREGQNRDY